MSDTPANVKPWERPAEPEHPMVVEGDVIPGDTAFMFRCLIEEMLRAGLSASELGAMSRNPNYQGLYAARVSLGGDAVDRIINEAAGSTGMHRVRMWEATGSAAPATLTVSAAGPCGRPGAGKGN